MPAGARVTHEPVCGAADVDNPATLGGPRRQIFWAPDLVLHRGTLPRVERDGRRQQPRGSDSVELPRRRPAFDGGRRACFALFSGGTARSLPLGQATWLSLRSACPPTPVLARPIRAA